jgi:FtsH-binding integral membrane protein
MYSERTYNTVVADAMPQERTDFIRRTYLHLAGAILAFALLEMVLFQLGLPAVMMSLLGTSRFSWLIVLAGFMGVSYLAEKWAVSETSIEKQYAGLGVYVVAEAIVFMPLLYIAAVTAGPDVLFMAAVLTLLLFAGLTYTAFTTKKDFTFLGGIIKVGGFVGLGIILVSILFGFNLGVFFSGFMIILAGAAILYNTSDVMMRYHTGQHVSAALSLFASVALLFWYVLRLLMGFSRRD